MLIDKLTYCDDYKLKDIAHSIRYVEKDKTQHYGSGANAINLSNKTIHFFQGGEFAEKGTVVVEPPLIPEQKGNLVFNLLLQIALKNYDGPINLEVIENLPIRLHQRTITKRMYELVRRLEKGDNLTNEQLEAVNDFLKGANGLGKRRAELVGVIASTE
ncbi:hypothetical protein [Leuconostoc citreum]|uniref:hypothetical protein n=1 Tax=Leuconostoc citreum TaxID=33964 RepID=UPI000BFEDC0D|nr:hypothetical protein [Leuconostoc citreum]